MLDVVAFKKALESLDNGAELIEFFENSVKAETAKGTSLSHRANAENAKYKKTLAKMGWESGRDLDEFADEIIGTIDSSKESANTTNTELSGLQSKLNKLQTAFERAQTELKAEKEAGEALKKQNKIKTIESKLVPKLSESLNGAGILVKSLLADNMVDIDDTGEITITDGVNTFGFDDGLNHIINKNADLRKNKQTPGAGVTPGGTKATAAYQPKYTMEQIKNMSQEEAAANVADINASFIYHSKQQ